MSKKFLSEPAIVPEQGNFTALRIGSTNISLSNALAQPSEHLQIGYPLCVFLKYEYSDFHASNPGDRISIGTLSSCLIGLEIADTIK